MVSLPARFFQSKNLQSGSPQFHPHQDRSQARLTLDIFRPLIVTNERRWGRTRASVGWKERYDVRVREASGPSLQPRFGNHIQDIHFPGFFDGDKPDPLIISHFLHTRTKTSRHPIVVSRSCFDVPIVDNFACYPLLCFFIWTCSWSS